ncbi:10894_t:CDS:2 [Scutellospora calospora]|uniref:10894_t:CDS:1 n=1 Tax=Scutellospora calospora TaxID=85575 RepID=A0ACA9K1V5_9GLOM|nr:10894_t:CDS:2 [Scutellospora calospora]
MFHNIIIHTQRCYGILLVTITQFFAPCNMIITTDESAKDVISPNYKFNIPERTILIANHQGMQFFDFIFLKRSWASDKDTLNNKLSEIANSEDPMWLLIFPEGTLVTEETRGWSRKYAAKAGLALKKSVHYIYDLTIGFDGITKGQYPDHVYNLKGIYFTGISPNNVHMHIRRYAIAEIPDDKDKFTEWLRQRWIEKDALMETFYAKGRFPTAESPKILPIRLRSINEIAYIWYFVIPLVWVIWNFWNTMIEKFNKSALYVL